jgi:beta-aspartyl-peptidase (threonine type)
LAILAHLGDIQLPLALAIHGGAWNFPDEAVGPSREGIRKALEHGWSELRQGACALDVVEAVVRILEDDPNFDAGRGSRLNNEGRVEMDASIMEGARLRAGAVAALRKVRHPISVARRVMEDSLHVMLVGEGARKFALASGAESCETIDLLVGRERERYLRVRAGERDLVEKEFDPDGMMGTVGAVALDSNGKLAAATSTGGTQDKAAGRVGDTPIIGAGTYANNKSCAVSSTGHGEYFIRGVIAHDIAALMEYQGKSIQEAADIVIHNKLTKMGGTGGIIAMDANGIISLTFNTEGMYRGYIYEDGKAIIKIYGD